MTTPTPVPDSKALLTNDDYSSLPKVIAWVLLVAEVFAVIAKLFTLGWMRRFRWLSTDNILIVLSLIFSIGLVVSVSIASTFGVGQRQANLTPASLAIFQKAQYASDLLFIVTITFSKAAVLVLLWSLTPATTHRHAMLGTGTVLAVWSLSSFLVAAFQCSVPLTWAILSSQCINRYAFWLYFGIFNIITELMLILLPCLIIFDLQSTLSKKLSVMGAFMLRTMVIGAIIAEIYYRARLVGSADKTFAEWPAWICALFVQALSIIFACVPFMKPFFSSLESGFVRTDDVRRLGSRQKTFNPIHNLISLRQSTGSGATRSNQQPLSPPIPATATERHIHDPTGPGEGSSSVGNGDDPDGNRTK